jgi:chromosome segregation ATPase
MQAELKAYEDKVDRLERQQAELAAYQEDNVPEKARAQLEQAREAIERVSMLKIQVEGGAEKLERAEADRGVARKAWDSRSKLVEELSASREKASTLSESVIANETELAPRAEGLTVLQTEYTGLKSHRDHLEADLRRARDIETLRQLSTECERLEAARKDAREADSKRRHCISEQGATRVTEASMTRLREIERTQDLAEERLSAVATRIEHRLEPGASVRLGNESLSGEGAVLLTRRTELGIESMGEISIIPGGEDLEANAEQTLRHSKRLEVQADQYEATIKGLAPDGLQALEDQYSSAVSRRDKLLSSVGDVSLHEKQASDLEFEAETLREQIRHIEEHLDAEEKAIQQLREMLVAARTEAKTAERDVENVTAELEQARGDISDDDMEKTLTASVRAADEADQSLKAARQALDAENPEAAEAEVERAQRVLNDIGQEIQVLERDVRDLKVELTALGQRGLAEEVASLESENASVDLQFNQMDRRARALDLLQRTLDVALQQAKEAVAQPITDKLVPYLRQLMPDAAPLVNEDLILTGINREGTAEAFSDLSIGTREQLAVLIRLAYADLLSAKGVPVVVILDDALVNSDDGRRDRMKAILYQAAKRYQILREYRDTGGRFIRLEKGNR